MRKNCDIRFFLLLLSLLTNTRSAKVLSDQKKCGDPECETSMSRVLAIKDYKGPDCRYLNFKAGEEIMVYFKLSGKREDLWAGSKGTDFGYFPTDAIKIEKVFITKEVEVPTKETDFLCLDGGEYVFENEDSTLKNRDEENEYLHLHTEVFPKEYKEPFPDIGEADRKSKDLHILEPTSHDSEIRDSKTGQAETNQQEDQNDQALKPLPTQSSWTISGFADWFSSESKENEETSGKSSEITREVTFRRRQIPIMDDSDSTKLNEESDLETRSSSWLKSTFTGLLQFGGEKAGLGLLHEENDPEILDSSSTDESVELDTTVVSETTDKEEAKSNWFALELSDVLPFRYFKGNNVKEEPPGREEIDQNEEAPPSSTQASLIHEDLRKQAAEAIISEEQNDEPIKQIVEPTLQEEQEKDDKKAAEIDIRKANERTDLDAAAPSFSTEFLDKIVKLYAEQDSEPRNQVMERINVQAIMKESEKTNGQSGWYESLYSNLIDFKRDTADNQPGHESVGIQNSQESAADQLQGLDPMGPLKHQPFPSISYFTNALNFQGLLSKESIDIPGVEKELKSSKESSQSKNSDENLHINKESKILLNQNIIEKISENRHVDTSQDSIVSFSEAENQEEYRRKTQDSELGKYKTPHRLSVKSKLKNRLSSGQCIQIHWNHTEENLEMLNNIDTKDKHMGHVWEVEQAFPVELQNVNSSPGIISSERSTLMKEEPRGEEAVQQKNEYINNSCLEETEMYLDKESKGEKGLDNEVESSLVTHENKFFREAKEYSDNFAQSGDIPGEDDILFDVGDENNLIHGGNEPVLSEKSKVMGTEIRETIRKPDSKSIDLSEHASTDQSNKNAPKERASENIGQSPFSSHSSQDTDLSDITNSEEKHRQFEWPQPFLSLSHYRLLFSFQSFTDENMNCLQGVQDDKSAKDEDSQSKSTVEILRRNKETEGNKQLYKNIKQERSMNIDFSNKGILLTSSAEQDNGDTEPIIQGAQSLTDTSTSAEKYLLGHTIDSFFRNQKLKEKGAEDKECTNIKGKIQSFSSEEKDYVEKSELIESMSPDAIKDDFPLCTNDYDKLNKSVVAKESQDQFSQEGDNEKNDISEHLTESDEGKQHGEEDTEKNDISEHLTESDEGKQHGEEDTEKNDISEHLTESDEGKQHGEEDTEKNDISEHLTESDEGKQHGEEDTENGSNKPTNEEDSNMLNQQGLSIEATLQGVFENENEIEGLAGHTLSYDFVNVKQNPQDLQMQIDEKSSEEKHGPTTDNGQHSESSLTAKVIHGHEPQEQKTSYLSSGTFPKEMTSDLIYQKEDGNEPKSEEVVASSYLEPLDRDRSSLIDLESDEKCTNQVACDTQIHLKAEKLKIPNHHKQIDNILNNDGSKPELQEKILDVMPKPSKVTSEKKTVDILPTMDYDRLFQKRSVAENVASEHPSLNLEVKSKTLETDNNVESSKLSPYGIPYHLEDVDFTKDHIPPLTKNSLDIHHLATDPDDKTSEQDRITPLPKHLKWVEEPGHSEHVKNSQGKDQKVIGNYEETEHSGRIESTRRHGVMSNIFGKTSWLFGELFQNKHKENVIENKSNGNIVATQAKVERQEADVVGGDFEDGKSEVQGTKARHYSHALKSIEQESRGKMHSLIMEKSATKDERHYNKKDDIQETESISQDTVQNDKWITDAKLDLKEDSFFTGFQETYIKLVAESKRILEANVCERHELQLLAQEFEKLYYEITSFSCEDVYSDKKQMTTSLEDEPKLKIMHERCLKTKMNLRLELQSLVLDIRNNCAVERATSGIINKEQLHGNALKESDSLDSHNEPNNSQHSEANNIPPVDIEEKMPTTIKNDEHHPDFEEKLPGDLRMTHNSFIRNESEREWLFQIILHLNDFCALITSGLSVITTASKKVVAALPENMRPDSDLHGFPWEIVICGAVLAIFVILLLVCRSYQSIRSRLYVGKEKQLASKVVELVEDKCKVLEKFSRCKKEYEELENSLKDASLLQGSTATSDLKKAYEELNSSNSVLKNEIALLEKEVREEKSKRSEQDDLMTEIQRKVEFLENEAKSIQSQVAEAKTTLKVYEINRERLKTSVQDALEENNHLQESQKQLLQEAEGWGERFSELNEQTKIFQCSKADMEEALKNKESQVKSLTECLLKMKDWSSAIGEHDDAEDSHWGNDIKCERENGEHLDDQEKRTIKKLIYAAKLNACLKSMETERNQMYSKLTDENKAKEELAERIESLQKEHGTLRSENAHFENEVQKLQQKLKVMSELYQENEMNLHRKLTVEERERLQKEEKLSRADEKIIHAAEELNTYRQQAKDLEEELERTVRSYQNQIMSHEKKAHDNWLTARAAERHLNDLRKENLHNRQKITETEFKYDVLEKDPYALDVPVRPFGREHSPYGPSPMGRPSSETRAFLSPPTLLEGPLRLSPVLPGGGGRGSRGPGNAYDIGNERGEMNSDRLPDSHRPPSDTGSLSPPWDRDHRINPSHTGQLYNEQPLPPRRPERFYSNHPNSGRFSGPGELKSYNMQSFDKTDGQLAENNSRMDLSGNGIKDHPDDSNAVHMTNQSLVHESDPLGPGIVPPPLPLLRPPLMPMDPRGAFIRRGPPFPPVPPSVAYGPREYFPRDFAGLPRPLMPMRGPFPLRPFSQYPPPRAGFFPPLPPDNRNELPAEPTHLSTASSTDHQESQET